MIPKRIAGATRYLGAPRGWEPDKDGDCSHLAILDVPSDNGSAPVMISAWEPTPAELAALQDGAPVYLQVVGSAHPPVMVWVEPASGMPLSENNEDCLRPKAGSPTLEEGDAQQQSPKGG